MRSDKRHRALWPRLAVLGCVPVLLAPAFAGSVPVSDPHDVVGGAGILGLLDAQHVRDLQLVREVQDMLQDQGSHDEKLLRIADRALLARRDALAGGSLASMAPLLDLERENLFLAERLAEARDGFQAAEEAVRARMGSPWATTDPALAAALEQELRNIETARELVALAAVDDPDARVLGMAERASRWQADALGVDWVDAVPRSGDVPSAAVLELLERHAVVPDVPDRALIETLDGLPRPTAAALAHVVNAFIAFEDAATRAFQAHALEVSPVARPELGLVLGARTELVGATLDLRAAIVRTTCPALPEKIVVPEEQPLIDLDLACEPSKHQRDVILLIDAGGDDTYTNNAGGNELDTGLARDGVRCVLGDVPPGLLSPAAAAIDLGGDDLYLGRQTSECGTNGGAVAGAGFLFDADGTDTYVAGQQGTNGGGDLGGLGFLVDLAGDDTYAAEGAGTNGGGAAGGTGLLLDMAGYDTYQATQGGVNGGASMGAVGMLFDGDGDDTFVAAGGLGANGGSLEAFGFLLDIGGSDTYEARGSKGLNGGASLGAAFLADLDGNDVYRATAGAGLANAQEGANGGSSGGAALLIDGAGDDHYVGGDRGSNGGASNFGAGFLVDFSGDDAYDALDVGTNGGAVLGAGLIFDASGDDTYRAGSVATNGGARGKARDSDLNGGAVPSLGALIDAGGADVYEALGRGTNGGGDVGGVGGLIDLGAGDDVFSATDDATNGGGWEGAGLLLETAGDSRYEAGSRATNGGAVGGAGSLIDGGGSDRYDAGSRGTNGGGVLGGGFLLDARDSDSYLVRDADHGLALSGRRPFAALCFVDADGSGLYSDGDRVYASHDSCPSGGGVEPGDLRLLPAAGQPAGSRVRAGESDAAAVLTAFPTEPVVAYRATESSTQFYVALALAAGKVTAEALRLTTLEDLAAGTRVGAASRDVGEPLLAPPNFQTRSAVSAWRATGTGVVYVDLDGSGHVTAGDVRLGAVAGVAAGTVVGATDPDLASLFSAARPFAAVCYTDVLDDGPPAVVRRYVYASTDPCASLDGVEPGDMRLTPVEDQPFGSRVAPGDAEVGRASVSFRDSPPMAYVDIGGDEAWSVDDSLFAHLAFRVVTVAEGDVRLTRSLHRGPGTAVAADDLDRGAALRAEEPRPFAGQSAVASWDSLDADGDGRRSLDDVPYIDLDASLSVTEGDVRLGTVAGEPYGAQVLAGDAGTNGGASTGSGLLIDLGGNDHYAGGSSGTNGGSTAAGHGTLVDCDGNDVFRAGDEGTNGGALLGGGGLLLDRAGNDAYVAGARATNGGGELAAGLLVDLGGHDAYTDAAGTRFDASDFPKGYLGGQVDRSPPG